MEHFSSFISWLQQLITYFSHSSFATQHLTAQRLKMGIKTGLVSIGNTRFLTIYWASDALLKCLPAIKELVTSKVLEPKDVRNVYYCPLNVSTKSSGFYLGYRTILDQVTS
jgi:hypothetical protein